MAVLILLVVRIQQHVTTILRQDVMMDHVCFLMDVQILQHVTTIQQQVVMMDHVALKTALHSTWPIHTVMVGIILHMTSHLTEFLLLQDL